MPDIEKLHEEHYRIYYQGKIYDVNRLASCWAITRPNHLNDALHTVDSPDEAISWLASCT